MITISEPSQASTGPTSRLYLWQQRTFYLGPLMEPLLVSQGAACFGVSLGGAIQFSSKKIKEKISCQSILIPPGARIECDTGTAPIAICMLDPLCCDHARLLPFMQYETQGVAYNVEDEQAYIDAFSTLYQQKPSPEETYLRFHKIISQQQRQDVKHHVDQRISKVIQLIQENIGDNLSIEILANEVGLSIPRLTQLFRLQTGVPMRRYRLWHRVFRSLVDITASGTLTNSALAAGFSDASHFNRTFRSMFGMTPSHLLIQPNGLEIYAEQK